MNERHQGDASSSYFLTAVVDRFQGKEAVLRFPDGQEIRWPVKSLPDDAHEGSVVRISIATSATEEEERGKVARTMLNELFKRAE